MSDTQLTNRKPVHIALLGCGAVSQLYYMPALRELVRANRATLSAIFDPNAAAMDTVRRHFPDAESVRDFEVLCRQEFDLAIIASPHSMHAMQAIELLRRGKSVLCEKPMATTYDDAQAMIAAASSASGVLAIGMVRRFFPASETIRRLISLQVLGDIQSFHFAEGEAAFRWPVASPKYFQKQEAHGGVLMDIGVHALDLMLWWFGEPLEVTYEDDAMGGIEVNCRLHCRFSAGFTGEIRLSRDCDLANRYTIHGTRGWISWHVNDANKIDMGFNDTRYALSVDLRHQLKTTSHPSVDTLASNFEQSFVDQLCNVIEATQGVNSLRVTAVEAARSLQLITHCYDQRNLLPMPWLSKSEYTRALNLKADVQ